MDKKLEQAYNEMVGIALINLHTLSKNTDAIYFGKFDITDEEHLFLLNVAVLSYPVLNKTIYIRASRGDRKAIAKMFDNCEIIKWQRKAPKNECFDTDEVISFMRPACAEMIEDEYFSFADVYHEFYERKQENA